jgi:hypothetical protein
MTVRSWLRKQFARPVSRPIKASARRPAVEALEDRMLLSTWLVTSLTDTGTGSGSSGDLRYCVAHANQTTGDNTINFKVGGVLTLTQGPLVLSNTTGTLTIKGLTSVPMPIKGAISDSKGFLVPVLEVNSGVTASISGLEFTKGDLGGVLNEGNLSLTDCSITGNTSTGGAGGIQNDGTLSLTGCTINDNSTSGPGAGLFNDRGASATLTDCTISSNVISWATGSNGKPIVGAGICNFGTLTVADSTLSDNLAGYDGAFKQVGSGATGAGLYNSGTATLSNCTFSGNRSAVDGGGVANVLNLPVSGVVANLTMTSCTVSSNAAPTGGGLFNQSPSLFLSNTILAGNFGDSGPDVSDADNHQVPAGNLVGGNPLLAPLGDNGGPTQTMALLPGSPAIDAGRTGTGIPSTDQRGLPRGARPDIGAFEVQGPTLNPNQATVSVNLGKTATTTGTFDDTGRTSTVTLTASLGTVTKGAAAGTWSWSYAPTASGLTTVTITATDATGLKATTTFSLTVYVGGPLQGGFEAPGLGTGWSAYQYNPSGTAWTFTGTSGVAGNGSGFTAGNPAAPEGSQVAFLQQYGSISQTVAVAAGTYSLTFSAAQRANYQASSQTFAVEVDGVVVGTFTPTGTSYASYTTGSFTLSAGLHTITFVGLDPDGKDNSAFIDQVQLMS